tara:strand:+ start:864 stop:4205 length:3342 start_codon:yes stop_codon:yes gene_type:complete
MATFSVNDQTRRVVASGAAEVSFSFQVNATSDVKVFVDGTQKTESTHYNIKTSADAAGLNTDGTGKVVFTTGNVPAGTTTVTILSDVPAARTSVYTAGGNITATSLEADFDTMTMLIGDREERDSRALLAPVDDPTTIDMTLPDKATRSGKVLGFDSSTGNPEATEQLTGAAVNVSGLSAGASPTGSVSVSGGTATFTLGIPAGATGATGATGAAGKNTGLAMTFSNSTSDADPGAGKVAFNNGTVSSVTEIYFDDVDDNSATVSSFIQSWDDVTNTTARGILLIVKENDPSVYGLFKVSGAVTNASGYSKVPVTHVVSNGSFSNTDGIQVSFAYSGADGAAGSAASIAVGSVTANTLSAGSSATAAVANAGSSSAGQFNFTFGIPTGATGATGPQGPQGVAGTGSGDMNDLTDDLTPQLGGDLDVVTHDIVSTSNRNIDILPNGSGKVNLDGDGSSGGVTVSDGLVDIRTGTGSVAQVKFYCESSNAHAQTIQPQPHAQAASNTLTLPGGNTIGNSDAVLVSDTGTQTLTNKTLTAPTMTNIDVDGTIKLDGDYPTGTQNVALGNTALDSVQAGGEYNTVAGSAAGTAITTGDANTAVGAFALDANQTGGSNTAIGYAALTEFTGDGSTAVGRNAGHSATSAVNTAVGFEAAYYSTTGGNNTAIGYRAFKGTTTSGNTGVHNTAIGTDALGDGLTADYNVAIGNYTLDACTTGDNNVGVGYQVLSDVVSGTTNVALGNYALENTTGSRNCAAGYVAMNSNTTGTQNTAFGNYALYSNTDDNNNTAIGDQTLYNNIGADNTAVGAFAMSGSANTDSQNNVAIGREALNLCTGSYNVAIGSYVSDAAGSGYQNVMVGYSAGTSNTSGYYNVFVGEQAGLANTSGYANVNVGRTAGYSGVSTVANTLVGHAAGYNITNGGNTGVGYFALHAAAGAYNTAIGQLAGNTQTGSHGVFIGYDSKPGNTSGTHEIVIGTNSVTGKGSSTGFINPNSGGVYQGNNSSAWSTTSDERLKKNIVDNNVGLDVINGVQVRNFEYRTVEEITELADTDVINIQGVQLGAIAQELETICPNAVKTEDTGVKRVVTDDLIWHMINSIKELSSKNDALEARLAKLES